MKNKLSIAMIFIATVSTANTYANGEPFKELEERINQLEAENAEQQAQIDAKLKVPYVIDAAGNEIGPLSVNWRHALHITTSNGYTLTVDSRDARIETSTVFFEELDCLGQAYSKLYPGYVFNTVEGHYYIPFDSSYGFLRTQSYANAPGSCRNSPSIGYRQTALPNDPEVTGFSGTPLEDGYFVYPVSVETR